MMKSTLNKSLAKALAYQNCGKPKEAEQWARLLIQQLLDYGVINTDAALRALEDWQAKPQSQTPTRHERILEHGYQAYAREEDHDGSPDY